MVKAENTIIFFKFPLGCALSGVNLTFTIQLLFFARIACAMYQLLVNLHTLYMQPYKEHNIMQKSGLHEATPKWQFKEDYGIFHFDQSILPHSTMFKNQ